MSAFCEDASTVARARITVSVYRVEMKACHEGTLHAEFGEGLMCPTICEATATRAKIALCVFIRVFFRAVFPRYCRPQHIHYRFRS